MPLALIMSSFVAAARIGGGAQQYVLAAHRIDPVLAPTVLLGRSPANGSVGEATAPDVFRRMLGDIEADAVFGMVDLVITGHFSSAEQVEIAAGVLERIRAADARQPIIVVDPIMGDDPGGLYVKPEVARALADRLIPLADWITPNTWELTHLTGIRVDDAASAAASARALGKPALVTSVPARAGEIGLVYCAAGEAILFAHRRLSKPPKGTGDLVAASFGAALVEGRLPVQAAEHASRVASEVVEAAIAWGSTELPIVAMADRMVRPTAEVRIERL